MGINSQYGNLEIEISMTTAKLLMRLKSNRKKHKKEFEYAIKQWQKELARVLKKVQAGKCFKFPEELSDLESECPKSHVEEYDQAIDMFSLCVTKVVKLDSDSFNTFCRDEWGWKSYTVENRFYRKIALN